MKNRSSGEELIREVFSDVLTDEVKQDSVETMIVAARMARRRRRQINSVGGALALAAFFALLFVRTEPTETDPTAGPTMATTVIPKQVPGTPIRVLSDEELFSMFPDRPIAVVTLQDRSQFHVLK